MEALNQKERSFAEENHGLIYAFLNYYKLPEAEYYDICAIAYLHAVKDWHSKPELREKYRFSTIAFKKMLSAKIKKYHADRVRDAYIAFSLNDLNAEGNEYLAQFPDPHDRLRETQEQQNIEELLKEIMPALTERQRSHLVKLLEGKDHREITREDRVAVTEFWKDRKAIRAATTAVIRRESCGGGVVVLGMLETAGYDHSRRVHDPEGIAPTATAVAGGSHHIKIFDYSRFRVRKLTPTEYGRLQGFPMDTWRQVVSNSQAYKQFGNAVTVPLAEAIGKSIIKFLNEQEAEDGKDTASRPG